MDDEALSLLREIRDLQRLHVEHYKQALGNQQQAIETQQKAVRAQRWMMLGLVLFVLLAAAILLMPSTGTH